MVAADRQWGDAGRDGKADAALDVLMREVEAEAAAEGDVADIGDAEVANRHGAQNVMIWPDPFDRAERPRAEAGAITVGDAEVHRHADQRHLQVAEVGRRPVDRT